MSSKHPSDRIISEHESDQRTPYQRDRDRILYSKEFRRLSGVTQVARVGESPTYHDRLTHSLKVAQVGSSIVDILMDRSESADIDEYFGKKTKSEWNRKRAIRSLVKTAALAHDLGHPPFGHAAEEELNDLVDTKDPKDEQKKYGGFEGNAQSFRIVTRGTRMRRGRRHAIDEGLNLTLASLNAILKYPCGVDKHDKEPYEGKWGYYPTEDDIVDELKNTFPDFGSRCLEADIMDYADDVTYAVHDMSDFYRAGLVPLDQLLTETEIDEPTPEQERFCNYVATETSATKKWAIDFFCNTLRGITEVDPLESNLWGLMNRLRR